MPTLNRPVNRPRRTYVLLKTRNPNSNKHFTIYGVSPAEIETFLRRAFRKHQAGGALPSCGQAKDQRGD